MWIFLIILNTIQNEMINVNKENRDLRKEHIKEKQELLANMRKRFNALNQIPDMFSLRDKLSKDIEAIQEEIDYLTEINKCLVGGIVIDSDVGTVMKDYDVTNLIDKPGDNLESPDNIFVERKI